MTVIEVPLSELPAYGLRRRTGGTAVHRFPDSNDLGAVAACVPECGVPSSTNPGDYKRVDVELVITSRRYHLCSNPTCFGRITAVPDAEAAETRVSR
jgi:hypothetical protein